ncbi:MAG: ROK family protein [Actinomycetota bacterium]
MRIGIDIGGTKVEAVAIDNNVNVIGSIRKPVRPGAAGVTEGAIDALAEVCREADTRADSIGIGIPGVVRGGVVHRARNLHIDSLDLRSAVAEATGISVRVANDVNAAALGAWALAGGSSTSFAYLNLGTGLAAGLVLGGTVFEGSSGLAGEIGYMSIDPRGPDHIEGLAGTLEAYASGSGVVAQWGIDGATVVDVFRAADAGDVRAIAIREGVYYGAASAVRVLALGFGADTVLVGGGLSGLGCSLINGMARHFESWSATSPVIASLDLGAITMLIDDDRPTHAIGAAIVGGNDD